MLPAGAFHLVLAGHLHAGQIAIPIPIPRARRLTLAHPRERFVAGLYPVAGGVMHVSPGTGHDVRAVPLLRAAGGDGARAPRRPTPRLQQST